jgi:hypothetical protein
MIKVISLIWFYLKKANFGINHRNLDLSDNILNYRFLNIVFINELIF